MTQNLIKGEEHPLCKVFSADFEYHIPQYQRPYAWTTEEAGAMLSDLLDFYETEKDDNYFLGSIVLVKEEGAPCSEVIDGQQRLTTLTILLQRLHLYCLKEISGMIARHISMSQGSLRKALRRLRDYI